MMTSVKTVAFAFNQLTEFLIGASARKVLQDSFARSKQVQWIFSVITLKFTAKR